MNEQNPTSALEQRINRLEKRQRFALPLIGLPIVALLLGAGAQKAESDGKTVKAENFVLVNAKGEERATLFLDDGHAHLTLLDSKGGRRVELRAGTRLGKQGAVLELNAVNEKLVLSAGESDGNGVGYIDFFDGKGKQKGGYGGTAFK